ncbi:MAG: hypothetical protein Q4Q04_04955 [Methanocorpusculum sp.]|nr:hypothetical protein [Methanocorpusculum sp.]
MQAVPQKSGRATITVTHTTRDKILSLKKGKQTAGDVIAESIQSHDLIHTIYCNAQTESAVSGIVAVPSILIHGVSRRLKTPLLLEFTVDEDNGDYIIVNRDFRLLTSNPDLQQGIQEIRKQFDSLWFEYVDDTSVPLSADAIRFKAKLQEAVPANAGL